MKRQEKFNYLFLGVFFVALMIINIIHVASIQEGSLLTQLFFMSYTIGQVLMEVLACTLCCCLLKRWAPRWVYDVFIGLLFLFLLSQILEAILVNLMDVSLSEAYHIAFGADFANFVELLELTELGLHIWLMLGALSIILPWIAVKIYKLSENHCHRVPVALWYKPCFYSLGLILLTLTVMDFQLRDYLKCSEYCIYQKVLPWKTTFLGYNFKTLPIKQNLKEHISTEEALNELQGSSFVKEKKPNIYLFVVESLRKDYISEETAPNLTAFQQAYSHVGHSSANANCTHTAWFSIFHGKYPFYWSYAENLRFSQGSLPLNLLKKMGYRIHVYSAAQLRFYHFDEVILGQDHHLADTFCCFPHYGKQSSSESDRLAVRAFQNDINYHEKEGNCYLIFLDSTHFNYSWPKDFPAKYAPAEEISWKHRLSKDPIDLATLQNRYKNAICYIDNLFDQCMQSIKAQGVYDESIVVFCGDHGEEFKEQGKLFHASHLNNLQTAIPLIYKLGTQQLHVPLSSQVDIFPSILHYVDQDQRLLKYFDGHSVLDKEHQKAIIAARYNACFHPYEFFVHNGNEYLLLKFNDKKNIFSSKSVHVLGLYDHKVEKKVDSVQEIIPFIQFLPKLFELDTSILNTH